MMRRIVLFGVLALLLGSLVAALALRQDFSLLEKYEVKADIVYVYLKLLETGENASGLWRMPMVSYIVVLNVTNPTDRTVRMTDVDFALAELVETGEHGASISNPIVRFYRYLPQDHISYFWYPKNSKLVVFSGVREFTSYGNQELMQTAIFDSLLEIGGRTSEGAYSSSSYVTKRIQLVVVDPYEYVYNTMPGTPRFHYGDDGAEEISFEL
ncbi:hypothetical protein MUP77_21625 [Candidatus Bathyarchaeota archaeon]|nr:hypothetical protein [Candidatus Bathyarchaeota archaeon]